MVISVLNEALKHKEDTPSDFRDFFFNINCILFAPIFNKYTASEAKIIVLYILYCYSEESPWLILNADSIDQKNHIANTLQLPEYLRSGVINMEDDEVRGCIVDWLDFQGKKEFRLLKIKETQYEVISNSLIKTIDPGKMKDFIEMSKYSDTLQAEIKNIKERMRVEYEFIYINKEQAESVGKAKSQTGNVENSQWIK